MTIAQFPHCDTRVLHAPEDGCDYCNAHPEWQELRRAWGIAFTGHQPLASLLVCGQIVEGYSRVDRCRQHARHDGDCSPSPEWETQPCPADAARPPGASNDHRRWGGNKPTSATGDPSWPAETGASRVMYGDKDGRAPLPRRERIRLRLRAPLDTWRLRRAGFHRDGKGWWRYP